MTSAPRTGRVEPPAPGAAPPADSTAAGGGMLDHDHGHAHGHAHGRGRGHQHADAEAPASAHQPAHDHEQAHGHNPGAAHAHSHGLGHAHVHAPANFNRAFAIGITLNLVFVLIEALVGWRVDSLALLADAGHNLSDVAGLLLAWGAAAAAKLRPDARYTYGWRRASIVAALLNALLLLLAMGALAWEAVGRLGTPQSPQGWTLITVAGIGMVVNTATALLFMRGSADDLNIRGAFLHMAADALVSLGVVVGGALVLWQGWGWIDPVMSLLIALVIVLGTWGLLRQSLRLVLDGVPPGIDLAAVRQALLDLPQVSEVHDLHVWALGTTETALTAHLVHDHADSTALLRAAEQALHGRFPIGHVTLQLESPAYAQACALRGHTGSG